MGTLPQAITVHSCHVGPHHLQTACLRPSPLDPLDSLDWLTSGDEGTANSWPGNKAWGLGAQGLTQVVEAVGGGLTRQSSARTEVVRAPC